MQRALVLVLGEVVWDRFADSVRLGGAPLNVAVQLMRLGHQPILVSAVGADPAGDQARGAIERLGLDTSYLQVSREFPTGSATVRVEDSGETSFEIERPAAYDAVELSEDVLRSIARLQPSWMYFGTLFPSRSEGRRILDRLLDAIPKATRVYDLNLRPGFQSPALVNELLGTAQVVKLNEQECPTEPATFLRDGSRQFGWRAACVTRGARGCVMQIDGELAEADGVPAVVVDTVGAGDAFTAAFIHGLDCGWPIRRVAEFCNETAARIVAVAGAIPEQ